MWNAVISAATQFGNSLLNRQTANLNTKRTLRAQKELAEYGYQKDLEMWNKANEYNSPAAQMQRLKDANLNPNLVYGSGSVAGNTSTQTPKYQQYNPEYKQMPVQIPDITEVLGKYQDFKMRQAQTDAVQEDVRSKRTNNAWLAGLLELKNQKLWEETQQAGAKTMFEKILYNTELNKGDDWRENVANSRAMAQYDATTRSKILDNQLKSMDKVLRSKGVNASDSLFMRMMTLDKSGYDVQELLPYMFLDTLGKAVPKLNLGFGKFSQKRGTERFYNPRKYGVYNRSTGEAF